MQVEEAEAAARRATAADGSGAAAGPPVSRCGRHNPPWRRPYPPQLLPLHLCRSLLPQPYALEVSNRVQVEEAEAAARRATAVGRSGAMAGYESVHGGGEEEDDGGVPTAVSSDPSDEVVWNQGPDAGPILLAARRHHSSVDLASSNITDHVSFLIFTSLLKIEEITGVGVSY